jgi:hypothetical protein
MIANEKSDTFNRRRPSMCRMISDLKEAGIQISLARVLPDGTYEFAFGGSATVATANSWDDE